jgi:uncharacterized protein YdhG (YjbR/CyaY superfamily)
MDDAVRVFIDAIAPERRPLFDRIHRIVMTCRPDAELVLSYGMPTFTTPEGRLHVGVWKHGLSFYGWEAGRDGGFLERHPELKAHKGTIQVSPIAAAGIDDDEFRDLIGLALGPR